MQGLFDAAVEVADFTTRVGMRVRSRLLPPAVGETLFGFRMNCDSRDFIQRRVYRFKVYEPNLSYYIRERVRPGDHVLDIGANVGYMTLLLSSVVGDTGKVVAIEASPATFAQLRRNLELNATRNVVALNMAATGAPCTVEIVEGEKNNSGSNSVRLASGGNPAIAGAGGRHKVTVRGDALANLSELDRSAVSFIKIDVEGSEPPILEHLLGTLDAYPNLQSIAVEMTPESAGFVARFAAAKFRAFGLPNNYRIGYFMVRQYLRRFDEGCFVAKIPVEAYDPRFRDFAFERAV